MRPNGYIRTSLLALASALILALPAQAQDDYGIGVTLDVPRVDAGAITLDGSADEAAWDDAAVIDLTQYWNSGFYDCAPNAPGGEQDIVTTGRLLFSDGVLYVSAVVQDYQAFLFPADAPWVGEYLLIGVDLTHEGDDQIDEGYEGWPHNAPNLGPTTYKISGNPELGITSNWGFNDISPVDSGWVAGQVFTDETTFQWGVEMAIYGDEIMDGGAIGFNAGGAAGHEPCAVEFEDAYAYYSWQAIDPPPSAGGDVMNNSASFATLTFGGGSSSEVGPGASGFALSAAYPNPFRATAQIDYQLAEAGDVELAVYDVLGRRVAVLDSGVRAAGEYRASLDGASLADGVYLVRLAVDGAVVATRSITRVH